MAIRVAILGGGVGGLSAAHELIERGFEVSVYEAKSQFGGKARSLSVPNTGTGGRKDLPGEHGFRFFPAFYRHLPDTMMRIPFAGNVSVFNNLVHARRRYRMDAGRRRSLAWRWRWRTGTDAWLPALDRLAARRIPLRRRSRAQCAQTAQP
jgi:uncharacterized protein with NAD-binding domain and iron-sulfur cluster